MVVDYFSVGVFGDITVRESNLVEYGSAVVLFRVPACYETVERAVAGEVALNREVDKGLGNEAAGDCAFDITRGDGVVDFCIGRFVVALVLFLTEIFLRVAGCFVLSPWERISPGRVW